MKQLLQSTFVLVAIVALLFMQCFNCFQLNNLEEQVIQQGKRVERLSEQGVRVRGGASGGSADMATAGVSAEEAEALRDPANLLQPHPPPLTSADKIVKGGTLRWQWGQDPKGLNIYTSSGGDMSAYIRFINNRLAYRQVQNPDVWSPELAIKVTTPDNGLSFEVTLRKGVMWQRPTVDWDSGHFDWLEGDHELTSDDYAFVFDMLANLQVTGRISPLRSQMPIEKFEVIDDYRFRVVFKERLFTNRAALLDLEPMPRWLYMYDEDGNEFDDATWGNKLNEHWYNNKAVGVGPYRFVSWEPGVKMVLERNDRFWGDRPNFDRQIILFLKDQNSWVRKLKTGEIDFTQFQPEQYKTELAGRTDVPLGNDRLRFKRQPTLGYFYLAWNADTPYFSDKRVRQAMTMAFNRPGIIENVFHGLGKIHTGPFAQQNPCYDKTVEPWPFDLTRAAAKLEEAGWRDTNGDGVREKVVNGERRDFEFTIYTYGGSTEYETISNIFREDLLKVGVKMNPRPVEWATMLKKMDEREFDAYTGAWIVDWDPDLVPLFGSEEADKPKSQNRIGFRNKQADELMYALQRELDLPKRIELCHELHRLMHDEQPYTFIYQRERAVVYWDHMNDLPFSLIWPYRDIRYFSFNQERP